MSSSSDSLSSGSDSDVSSLSSGSSSSNSSVNKKQEKAQNRSEIKQIPANQNLQDSTRMDEINKCIDSKVTSELKTYSDFSSGEEDDSENSLGQIPVIQQQEQKPKQETPQIIVPQIKTYSDISSEEEDDYYAYQNNQQIVFPPPLQGEDEQFTSSGVQSITLPPPISENSIPLLSSKENVISSPLPFSENQAPMLSENSLAPPLSNSLQFLSSSENVLSVPPPISDEQINTFNQSNSLSSIPLPPPLNEDVLSSTGSLNANDSQQGKQTSLLASNVPPPLGGADNFDSFSSLSPGGKAVSISAITDASIPTESFLMPVPQMPEMPAVLANYKPELDSPVTTPQPQDDGDEEESSSYSNQNLISSGINSMSNYEYPKLNQGAEYLSGTSSSSYVSAPKKQDQAAENEEEDSSESSDSSSSSDSSVSSESAKKSKLASTKPSTKRSKFIIPPELNTPPEYDFKEKLKKDKPVSDDTGRKRHRRKKSSKQTSTGDQQSLVVSVDDFDAEVAAKDLGFELSPSQVKVEQPPIKVDMTTVADFDNEGAIKTLFGNSKEELNQLYSLGLAEAKSEDSLSMSDGNDEPKQDIQNQENKQPIQQPQQQEPEQEQQEERYDSLMIPPPPPLESNNNSLSGAYQEQVVDNQVILAPPQQTIQPPLDKRAFHKEVKKEEQQDIKKDINLAPPLMYAENIAQERESSTQSSSMTTSSEYSTPPERQAERIKADTERMFDFKIPDIPHINNTMFDVELTQFDIKTLLAEAKKV